MSSSRMLVGLFIAGLFAAAGCEADPDPRPGASAERMESRIMELSAFGANPEGGVSRVAFSQADIDARHYIGSLMTQAGLTVSVDAAGNLIGSKAGSDPDLPPIVFGSHIDSVPGGGNYDGDVGVIGALEAAQLIADHGIATRHPLEVVVFSDEEGGLTGSRAMIGKLGPAALETVSHSGLTIAEGIAALGGDPGALDTAVRREGDLAAFIELHIEQGGILDGKGLNIGVVTGIVGINWWDVVIEGMANHAGTTPMNQRRDALLAAAELVLAVNEVVTSRPGTQVGTVGRIQAEPGAPNVIPGEVVLSLEIRDLDGEKMQSLFRDVEGRAAGISDRRGVTIDFERIDVDAEPALTDSAVRNVIAEQAEALGLTWQAMPSGAGHDAQDMARIAPTGMIFVPSRGGISHSPDEYTAPRDMANGADVLLGTILAIDQGALEF